jgi:hypothetical protein
MPIQIDAKLNAFRRSPEEWRPIEGWPRYQVSSLGRVCCVAPPSWHVSPGIMKGWKTKAGYIAIQLSHEGRTATIFVHRLVCAAFHGPCPTPEHQVCHNDGTRDNNREDNLRWGTATDNNRDTSIHGRSMRGEKCHRARLTDEIVRDIRRRVSAGERQSELARAYGIRDSHVSRIVARKQWGHVE